MKKILIVLWFILILSACNPNETNIDCADGFELDQYGQCVSSCDDGMVLIGGVCEIIIPVCGVDQILNEETLSCEPKKVICEEPFVEIDGVCINSNIVLDFSEMSQELKKIFNRYDASKDEIIDLNEAGSIRYLDLSNLMLTDISFLSGLYRLETLDIQNNSISDVSGLNALRYLTELNAGKNLIENICTLSNENLESLYLNDNLITEINCLDELNKIRVLDASNNKIKFIEKLNIFPIISYVDLSHNEIIGISELDRLYFLEYLDLSYNNIVFNYAFEDLVRSHDLVYLNVSYNDMNQIDPFNAITSLEEVNIDGNNISNISSLEDLVNLKIFNSKGQAIRNIEVIENWISLEEINLEGQYLSSIEPLFNVPTLTSVDISNIDLSYENIISIVELSSMGINVTSGINLDTNGIPLIMSKFDTIYAYTGENKTLTDLGIIAYDIEDGRLEDDLISNYYDVSLLSVGEYTLDLSLMDSDGNISEKSVPLVIRERINMSNLVVFVTFSDYTFYYPPNDFDGYYDIFNGSDFSLKDYYLEISDGEYIIESVFTHDELYFFESEHPRSYYRLQSPANPNGYGSVAEQKLRERELLRNISIEIEKNNYIDEDVILDANEDGVIDGITLMVAGYTDNWNQLLWPHTYFLDSKDVDGNFTADSPTINGKYVYKYNMQFLGHLIGEDTLFLGVIAHEVFHIIGAPDLYHYYQDYDINPIGGWGLMDFSVSTPKHPLQYTKENYGGFYTDEIYVSEDGLYTLNRTTLLEDNVIVIDLQNSNEFLYIEYRTRVGDYEIGIPTEGTIVYRVDKDFVGNYLGMYDEDYNSLDEVFVFREATFIEEFLDEDRYIIEDSGNTDYAALNYGVNETTGVGSNTPIFYSDGTEIMISITITEQNEDHVIVQIDFIE